MSVVVIFGATGTIGSALARRLVRLGRQVLLAGRSEEKLKSLSDEIRQPYVTVDMSDSQSFEEAIRDTAETLGGVGAFVNCVGSLLLKPAHITTDDEFHQVVETNLFTAFATVRMGAKHLLASALHPSEQSRKP